ncbi:hypothetical protein ACVWXN_003448 [Bradyrhizobium sp. i1.4.4]
MGPAQMLAALSSLTEEQLVEALRAPTIRPDTRLEISPRPLEPWRPPPAPRFDSGAMAYLRDRVFEWIEREIRYRYRPGQAPPCRRVEIMYEPVSPRLELRFSIYDGRSLAWVDGSSIDAQTLSTLGFDRICKLFFDRAAENFNEQPSRFLDWRSDGELRSLVDDCSRGLMPLPPVERGYFRGVDLASGPDSVAYTVQRREQ